MFEYVDRRPFTVPCRMVFALLEDLEMWPYHLSFRFVTMVRKRLFLENRDHNNNFWIGKTVLTALNKTKRKPVGTADHQLIQ